MSCLSKIFQSIIYINQHLNDEITLEQCSCAADMSVAHYINKFKQYLGFTPLEYIRKVRLEGSCNAVLNKERLLDIAIDTGYGSNEAYTRAFKKEYGVAPSEYQNKNILCSIDQLNDTEKIVVFLPAPEHCEYNGDLYYKEHKEIYDSLAEKGYFDKESLGYRTEAKQLTEKYAYDFEVIILHLLKTCDQLTEVYDNLIKLRYLPLLLFYTFVKEIAENGLLDITNFNTYQNCAGCSILRATLGDADFIREEAINDCRKAGYYLSLDDIYCLGYQSHSCITFCPLKDLFNI